MAKRGADAQLTKDDERSDDEDGNDPGTRSAPLAPVEGRQIRGMPKRRGLGGGAPTPVAPAPTPAAAPAAGGAFSGFSFGAPATSNPTPFVFGSSSSSNAPQSTPFTATSAPPVTGPTLAATPNPFASFSFGAKPSAPAPATVAETPKPSTPAFGFGAKSSATPANPIEAPKAASATFSFGGKSAAAPPTPVSAPSATPAAIAQPPKPFAGFSFNATPSTSSLAPTTSTTSVSSTSSPFAFGASSAPSSTAAMTSFSSSIAQKPSEVSPPIAPPTPTSTSSGPNPSQSTPPDEKQVSYYTSLRGLNHSFLSFLTSSLENDPFLELSSAVPGLLEQYGSYISEAATKAGWKPEGSQVAAVNGTISKTANGLPKPPAPPAVGGFTLPKAPTVSSTAVPSFGGFTPTLPAGGPNGSTSPFAFGGTKPPSAQADPSAPAVQTPKKPSAEITQLVQDVISGKDDITEEKKAEAPKPFTFGAASVTSASESSKKPTALFSFSPSGPLHHPTPESKTFTPSSSLESASTPAKLGKFGPGGSQPQLAFGGAKSSPSGAPDSPAAAKPFSFGFGSGSGSAAASASTGSTSLSFGSGSNAAASSVAKPVFSFGSTSQPASTPSFSFGSTSTDAKPATSSSASGFSFTPFNPKPATESSTKDASGGETEGEHTPTPGSPSKNLAETTGAGEENEETVVEQRGKLHSLEDGKFKVEGLGQFKLKRAKEGGKRRLLMRTDGSGHVILNMSVNGGFKPTTEGPTVRFLGFNKDGKPVPYALRVKNPQVANELQAALQKEVDAIKE